MSKTNDVTEPLVTVTPQPPKIIDRRNDIGESAPTCGANTRIGDRVLFAHPDNGWADEGKRAQQYLRVGRAYTVSDVDAGQSLTRFGIEGIHGHEFNSVLFMPYPRSPTPATEPAGT